MAGKNTLELNEQNFQQQVLDREGPVLVDFFADWCAPCRAVGPVVDALADEYTGQVPVGKVNVDNSPQLAAQYGIRSIPALLVFRDGEVVNQLTGSQSQKTLAAAVEAARSQPTA